MPWRPGRLRKRPRRLAAKTVALAAQAQKDGNLTGIAKDIEGAGAAEPGAGPQYQ